MSRIKNEVREAVLKKLGIVELEKTPKKTTQVEVVRKIKKNKK